MDFWGDREISLCRFEGMRVLIVIGDAQLIGMNGCF